MIRVSRDLQELKIDGEWYTEEQIRIAIQLYLTHRKIIEESEE